MLLENGATKVGKVNNCSISPSLSVSLITLLSLQTLSVKLYFCEWMIVVVVKRWPETRRERRGPTVTLKHSSILSINVFSLSLLIAFEFISVTVLYHLLHSLSLFHLIVISFHNNKMGKGSKERWKDEVWRACETASSNTTTEAPAVSATAAALKDRKRERGEEY